MTLIDNIIKTIEDDLCVNEKQRFTMGFSYGGAMSYSLACSRPNVFRAVAVLSGNQLSGCAGGNDPVAYYGQHGVHDKTLNINGATSCVTDLLRITGARHRVRPSQHRAAGSTSRRCTLAAQRTTLYGGQRLMKIT